MPKETRTPKSEVPLIIACALESEAPFWSWADDAGAATSALHDGESDQVRPPRDLMERTASEESLKDEARQLWREAKELNLIFGAMWRKER